MWDTAGSERFKSLIPTYLKNANSIILTYDITSKILNLLKILNLKIKYLDKNSFLSIPQWLKDISDKVPEDVFIIVVGNKLDMEAKRYIKYIHN